jgi:hypothetical protein
MFEICGSAAKAIFIADLVITMVVRADGAAFTDRVCARQGREGEPSGNERQYNARGTDHPQTSRNRLEFGVDAT